MEDTNNIINSDISNQPIQPLITTPLSKSNIFKYLFILSFVILLASIAYSVFLLTKINSKLSIIEPKNNVSQITPTGDIVDDKVSTDSDNIQSTSEYIPILIDGNHKKININTKKIITNEEVITDFYKMVGLPKEYKNSKNSLKNNYFLKSKDKSKVIVRSITYDETSKPSEFDGSLPILNLEDYLCNINDNKCTRSDIIPSIKKDILYWSNWDSQKNLLYGHFSGEGVGNASPVHIYDINNKTDKETIGFDSLKEPENRASIPKDFLSPSFSKFIMFTEKDDLQLLLFNTNNLSKPEKIIKLKIPGELYEITPRSIAWFKDEKNIILLNNKQVFKLNLDTEELSSIYLDQTQNTSYSWLDFNNIYLSSNEKYIAFVDFETNNLSSSNKNSCILKAINLDNNETTNVFEKDGFFSLEYY